MAQLPTSPSSASQKSSAKIVRGDGHKLKISPNAASAMAVIERVKGRVNDMVQGRANPTKVRAELERLHYRQMRKHVWAGAGSVEGAKDIAVIYREGPHQLVMDWEYLPGPNGPMVLGVCPKCWAMAPSQVKAQDATRPTFVDGQLARIKGDPEADKKIVPFRITSETHKIRLDEQDRLYVEGFVRCPDRSRCSWVVKIAEGVARQVNTNLSRSSGKGGAIKGPLIIVK